MREKWDPIFTFQHSGQTKAEQLENNTTKGLLKLLQDTNPRVLADFLSLFVGDFQMSPSVFDVYEDAEQVPDERTLRTQPAGDPVTFHTQRGIDSVDTASEKGYVLGISRMGGTIDNEDKVKDFNIPDGIIDVPHRNGSSIIVLEVKTGADKLTEDELNRYAHSLDTDDTERLEIKWRRIYDFCLSLFTDASLSKLDRYLLAEYARYLEYEQLEMDISDYNPDSGHRKLLQLKRLNGDSSVFEDGKLGLRIRWTDENSNKTSNFGWISAEYFSSLLGAIPESIREMTFSGEEVNYEPLIEWVYEEYPELEAKEAQHVYVPERGADIFKNLPGESTRHLQFRWTRDDDGEYYHEHPNLRLYRKGASCPDLAPDAFEELFEELDAEVREKMFCGEINLRAGWRSYLRS
ncbi:hypothetical protein ACFQMA_24140 [Halosimplex aquaticum]|uniref:PD-(D/E)XK nuclease superfamily protein n=1 Tax=Halosimplex aquaticum TaxID=3026162 RepID=A0ABD5YAK6_9EURY|nr:hypothetical protein [Halosimplex aquaticum]